MTVQQLVDKLETMIRDAKEVPLTVDRLDDTLHTAPPVPLTDQARVERRKIDEMIQSMRAAFSQGTLAALTN